MYLRRNQTSSNLKQIIKDMEKTKMVAVTLKGGENDGKKSVLSRRYVERFNASSKSVKYVIDDKKTNAYYSTQIGKAQAKKEDVEAAKMQKPAKAAPKKEAKKAAPKKKK